VHGGDLLPTIRTWLEHDRQTDKAAEALHIHPNTLLYRVRRFEQITGRSLASTEALAETWLALRAAATLSTRGPLCSVTTGPSDSVQHTIDSWCWCPPPLRINRRSHPLNKRRACRGY